MAVCLVSFLRQQMKHSKSTIDHFNKRLEYYVLCNILLLIVLYILTINWHGVEWTVRVEAGPGQQQGVLGVVIALDPDQEYQQVNTHQNLQNTK